MTTKKTTLSIDDAKYAEFKQIIEKICGLLKTKIPNKVDLASVLLKQLSLKEALSKEYKGKPEPFTQQNIIEQLLDFLGYTMSERAGESELEVYGRRWPDYKLIVSPELYLLVEAEPLNSDLYAEGHGVQQVVSWIQNKACTTDYGIATDGFRWILVEFSIEYGKHRVVKDVDLSPFFKEKLGFQTLVTKESKNKQLADFINYFSKDRLEKTLLAQEIVLENYQEMISKKFYDKYMQLVFGNGKNQVCLVNSISGVDDAVARQKIAQAIVNRLIFVKFIEAKGWMNSDKKFLVNLWRTYSNNPTGSFYDSYMKILFFHILNNPHDEQKKGSFAGIRYLNGGLFRKTLEEETHPEYSVDDDIIAKLIDFLEGYRFGEEDIGSDYDFKKDVMSPEILGYIFERTVNHEKGAYYTPDNVTKFITNGTLQAYLLDLVNARLKEHGSLPTRKLENALADGSLDREDINRLYSQVQNLKILDPGCGSGAFFMPVINYLLSIHKRFMDALGLPFNAYSVKKKIIENNIYGVDINPPAIEIAKLRLWLELVSSVRNVEDADLLPNIEYNIIAGNTLLGFDQSVETKVLDEFSPLDINEFVEDLAGYPDHKARIKELSEKPTIKNVFLIKDLLVRLYKSEPDPTSAQNVKKTVEKVHVTLQKIMNSHFLQFINGKVGKKEQIKTVTDLEKFAPFHWILEFNYVFSNGGFDVILGNPPYVEFREIGYPLSQFETYECGNIYAPFFERAVHIVKDKGYFGYIVPISSVCTERMNSLQRLLISNTKILKISNFDDRPDKIFKGLEHCRSSIIFGSRGLEEHKVKSTHYHRWYAEEREKLFKSMAFVDVTDIVKPGIIPKIGKEIEKNILKKIESNKTLSTVIVKKSKESLIYHNAPQYWIRAMDFMPEFSNDKGSKFSPHNKQIFLSEETDCLKEVIATLNSSLFYWFFILNSNCRDFTEREIRTFPFDVTSMDALPRNKLKGLCFRLMDDYKEHSKLKDATYKRTGKVVYREFYPRKSKAIIDEIDAVLAEHYNFTDEEKQYIINFDIRFRMGAQELEIDNAQQKIG